MINNLKRANIFGGIFRFKNLVFIILFILSFCSYGQTNAPSIQSGATFQWVEEEQPSNNSSATIRSITINNNFYDDFRAPSGYILTQVGPGGNGGNRIKLKWNKSCYF